MNARIPAAPHQNSSRLLSTEAAALHRLPTQRIQPLLLPVRALAFPLGSLARTTLTYEHPFAAKRSRDGPETKSQLLELGKIPMHDRTSLSIPVGPGTVSFSRPVDVGTDQPVSSIRADHIKCSRRVQGFLHITMCPPTHRQSHGKARTKCPRRAGRERHRPPGFSPK